MKKIQVNSPEYRALVSSLLGKEVKFDDVPQIEIRKSPDALPVIKKKNKATAPENKRYVVIRTNYTSRLLDKFGCEIEKDDGDEYVIFNPKRHKKLFEKLLFTIDFRDGVGIYSSVPLKETSRLMNLLGSKELIMEGIVVFKVKNLNEGDDLVDTLNKLKYCRMFFHQDTGQPYEQDQIYNIDGHSFRYIAIKTLNMP